MADLDPDTGDAGGGGEERNYETEARAEGWRPLENFKGDPTKWIDAKEFVERGENILPLVKAQNSKLKAEQDTLKRSISEMRASMDEFKLFHEETSAKLKKDAKEAYSRAEADLEGSSQAGSSRVATTSKVDEINDNLVDLKREAEKEAEKSAKAPTNKSSDDISKTPEFKAWAAENDWFGQDDDMSAVAVNFGQRLRTKSPNISLTDYLEQVAEHVKDKFGIKDKRGETASKVEGARRGAGGSGGKGYADLPSEARKQCDADVKKHVGENKVYKTAKAYQEYFSKLYFED